MPELLSTERFPATRWSAIRASAEVGAVTRSQGFAQLVAAYWRPVYVYLRLRHRCSDSDAHDFTQSFFAQWWEQNTMAVFDPARARFRTFVRLCVDRHVVDHKRSEGAKKRGGEWEHVDVDVAQLERDAALIDPTLHSDPERLFEAEWVRSLLQQALLELRHVHIHLLPLATALLRTFTALVIDEMPIDAQSHERAEPRTRRLRLGSVALSLRVPILAGTEVARE